MGRTRLRLIFLVAAVHVLVTSSQATVWIVDDDGQDSPIADFTTIQPAIDACAPSDSIFVYPGTYTGPGQYVVDLQGKDITLTSIEMLGGASVTFIDGQSQRGGLRCGPGTTSLTQITGFTIQNCQVSSGDARGGGIYCDGSPTISGCTISGNKAIGQDYYARGGGIFIGSNATSPFFYNCTISNNQATANLADAQSRAQGGGVYIYYGASATFEHCMVSGNLAANLVYGDHISEGGGIYNAGTGVSLQDCTIMTNTASTVSGETLNRGGGGGVFCIFGDITLTDCKIEDNISTYYGGGLVADNGDLTLVNCDVSSNTAGNCGGGLSANGPWSVLQITSGSITGNATTYPPAELWCGGGGINCSIGQSSINGVDISGNQSANEGGGLYYVGVGTHTLSSCTVVGNIATRGGGISCQGAGPIPTTLQVLIQNCQIGQNLAYGGSGGGLNIASCNPEIAYCDISDNSTTHFGGGLYGSDSSKPTILDTTIKGNSGFGGGGMYVDASEAPDTEFSLTAVVLCGNTPNQACGPWVDDGVCLVESCDGLNNPSWPTACGCPADFNTDNKVDSTDLQQVIANMGDEGGVSDIAADCGVNILDLLDVLSQWGPCS
jgi:hypothetical protein